MKIKLKNKLPLASIVIILLAIFLRIYKINSFPPSLYWEEVALGYDAYSILETGKDHHGNYLPVVAFESFGDWKPSLYFYILVPFIWIFGLNSFAVRLPAAISGVLLVIAIGLFSKEIAQKIKQKYEIKNFNPELLSKISMLIAAISPWAIQFSRAAWEVNLATCLITWAILFGYRFINLSSKDENLIRKIIYFISSIILLCLSMYCYHAARFISPFLGLGMILIWLKKKSFNLKNNLKILTFGLILAITLISPLLFSLQDKQVSNRFTETSIFFDLEIIEESNLCMTRTANNFISKLFCHRYILFSRQILKNYLSHFNLDFLFISGDINPRHSVQFVGQLYHIEFIFIIIGLIFLIKHWHRDLKLLICWLITSIFPASITKTTPHALRILPTIPVFFITISFGIYAVFLSISTFLNKSLKKIKLRHFAKHISLILIGTFYLLELINFWRFYSQVYPKFYSQEWQYGYQRLITSIRQYKQHYSDHQIYITRDQGRPSMYYFFYTQTDPRKVQHISPNVKKDQSEILAFENIKFINSSNEVTNLPAILASSPEDFENMKKDQNRQFRYKKLNDVMNLNGKIIWSVYLLE